MQKQVIQVFGREYYLLGEDVDGIKYWLEEPRWDCDWYWGFGYIETFTNNSQPTKSKDIESHQHANNFYPRWVMEEDSILKRTPFTEKEKWLLAEYFKQFYLFKELAEYYYHGYTNITKPAKTFKDLVKWEETNKHIRNNIIQPILNLVS